MNTSELLSSIESEKFRFQQVRSLLVGDQPKSLRASRPRKKHHTMSAEGRARIAAAQKARWAKQEKAAKGA